SWFRAAGISDDHRQGYVTVCAAGRAANSMALTGQAAVRPLLDRQRLLLGIDDTPTPRYGPRVEGCGIHHNPSPGPAGEPYVYGHVPGRLRRLARSERHAAAAETIPARACPGAGLTATRNRGEAPLTCHSQEEQPMRNVQKIIDTLGGMAALAHQGA